jgi:hypothetical protein
MREAIVNSGSIRYVCEIADNATAGNVHTIYNVYELRKDSFLIPTPSGPAVINQNSILPIDAEDDVVTSLECFVNSIRFFYQMPDKGANYENLLDTCQNMLIANRASRSGITLTKDMPSPKKSGLIV